jgi:4a-hydroxytetrahydrobiopterin dehydratase
MGTPEHRHESCHCHPRSAAVLDSSAIEDRLRQCEGWETNNGHLVKTYRFPDLDAALAFIGRVGAAARSRNYHPHTHWWKREVRLEFWTHQSNGLTDRDFEFASACNKLQEV